MHCERWEFISEGLTVHRGMQKHSQLTMLFARGLMAGRNMEASNVLCHLGERVSESSTGINFASLLVVYLLSQLKNLNHVGD